jgi:hypothetical protein
LFPPGSDAADRPPPIGLDRIYLALGKFSAVRKNEFRTLEVGIEVFEPLHKRRAGHREVDPRPLQRRCCRVITGVSAVIDVAAMITIERTNLIVYRGRLEYPDLRCKVISLAAEHRVTTILIEDAGPGMNLLQDLRAAMPRSNGGPVGED